MKEKLDKWNHWLDEVYADMRHQAGSRTVFKETEEIIKANPNFPKDNDFLDYLRQWYVDSTVMGLRRQLKVDSHSVSLVRLLDEIATNAELLSRQRFVDLYPQNMKNRANKEFDKYAGASAAYVPAEGVRADIDQLKSLAKRCEEYADRLVAHRDKRGVPDPPSYKELDEAIDFMETLLKKYYLLLRGEYLASVRPKFINPWQRIFEIPWLPARASKHGHY
ncbi:MAG TPA: hypothetical protein VNP04_22925 [Alphaproteobacteria bacterium]|jgi:hypothetical protein|nr:hypothetical protein [Alphaproteobacteria bacterium]